MSDSQFEIVDDRDLRVAYSGEWELGGDKEEYSSTTHGTYTAGSRATFTFKGSSVEVYGTTSNRDSFTNAAVSTYSIDGSPPETFSPPPPSRISFRQKFYSSPILDDEQHVLVITSTVSNTAFWLDYFQIASNGRSAQRTDPVTSTPPTTSNITSTMTRSITQSPSSRFPGGLSQTTANTLLSFNSTTALVTSSTPANLSQISTDAPQTSANTPALPADSTPPIGAIVGGVIGGVVLILLCLFIVHFWWKKRPQRVTSVSGTHPSLQMENTRVIGDISPFTGHWNSVSGSGAERIGFAGESIVPRDAGQMPQSVHPAAFRKSEIPAGTGRDPHEPVAAEALPPYSFP